MFPSYLRVSRDELEQGHLHHHERRGERDDGQGAKGEEAGTGEGDALAVLFVRVVIDGAPVEDELAEQKVEGGWKKKEEEALDFPHFENNFFGFFF